MTRRAALLQKGEMPRMPVLEWGHSIIEYLFEVGPTMADGPLTFSEIECWMRTTHTPLAPFEVQLLRRLSVDYANESFLAVKRDRPAPFGGPPPAAVRRRSVEQDLDKFLA